MKTLIAGLLTLYIVVVIGIGAYKPQVEPVIINHDERIGELTRFMSAHNFATPYYVKDYLSCADKSGNDWRLLPVISLLESSGGRFYPRPTNNEWGWNSANYSFKSIPEGICFISSQLANGRPYKGKTIEGKIKTYNSVNPAYYANFIKLYNEIK